MYKSKSVLHSNSGSNRSSSNNENKSNRYSVASALIDEEEYNSDHNQIYNDDSKFARQLKKLLRDEEEERKIQKILDLSTYLDQQENIKFVLKLAKPSLNILTRILWEQQLTESKNYLVECISKIGFIMLNERDQNKYFDWTLDKVSSPSNDSKEGCKDTSIKILLLEALQQNFRNESTMRYLKDNINYILNNLKKELEIVDTPEIMMKITKTIIQISNLFPDATLAIFQDIVDILIAWHIDCSICYDVIDFISNTLVEFRPYWLKEINFTITLLYQFLEDMESYMPDSNKRKETEKIEKISALLKVYNTVIKSISCIGDPSYQRLKMVLSLENTDRIIESLRRLLVFVCSDGIYNSKCNELIFGPTNYCIELFFDIFDEKIFVTNELFVEYLNKQNKILDIWPHEVDFSFVRLLSKIVGFYIVTNNISFFSELFSFDGRLWNYKFSQNSKLIQETLSLYKALIIVKSIPIVQEVYRTILNDADTSLNTILKSAISSSAAVNEDEKTEKQQQQQQLQETSKGVKMLDVFKNAETSFLFDLCIFSELGNAKNNLICMYALSPTLFELLTAKLSPCNWNLAESYPNIQFAILNTLYSHCLRHEHFIVSSALFSTKNSGSDNSAILTNAPTRDHFKIMIEILTKIISHSSSSFDLSLLILNWLTEIIDLISTDNSYIFETPLFTNLYNGVITAAYSNETQICLLCSRLLFKTLQKFGKLNENLLLRLLDLCKYYIMSTNEKVRDEYIKLLCIIPINVVNSQNQDTLAFNLQDFSVFSSLVRIHYMSSSLETNISVNNFKSIMGYLLTGLEQHSELYNKTWLERIFFASQHNINFNFEQNDDKIAKPIPLVTLDQVIEEHDGLLWFWALWECAQFCVQSRLKTPLGKAQDTFIAIEGAIKFYFQQCQLQTIESKTSAQHSNITFDLTQITLAVHFVEYLEKLIYNAYEGTAESLHPVQKAVKIFFRTNKNTCNEWFWRVRFSLICICLKNAHYEIAVRHSYEYINYSIQHNLTNTTEFDQVIVWLVESFICLRSWQSIIGLHEWLTQTIKRTGIEWILTAAKEAQGRLEFASQDYNKQIKVLTADLENSSALFFRFQNEKLFECYFELHDWKQYLDWYTEYMNITAENESLINRSLENSIDINYIKSLHSFEIVNNIESARSSLKECTTFKSLDDLTSTFISKYNNDEIVTATYKEIYKYVINKRVNNFSNNEFISKLATLNLNVLSMDESSVCNSERIMIAQLSHLIQSDPISIPFLKSLKFDPNKHSPKSINNFRLLIHNNSKPDSIQLNDLRLASARLARKQMNYNLASRLITEHLSIMHSKPNMNPNNSSNIYENIKSLLKENSQLFIKTTNQQTRIQLLECELEAAKLLYEVSKNEKKKTTDSISILVNSINQYSLSDDFHNVKSNTVQLNQLFINPIQANNSNSLITNDLINEMCARSIITLFKWLKRSDSNILKDINTNLDVVLNRSYDHDQKSDAITETIAFNLVKIIDSKKKYSKNLSEYNDFLKLKNNDLKQSQSQNEMILGDLLDLSTLVSPKLAKTWYTMANWCYKWGKRNAEKIQLNFNKSVSNNQSQLVNEDEKAILLDLLPTHTTNEEKEFVMSMFLRGFNSAKLGNTNLNKSNESSELCFNQQTEVNNEKFVNEVRSLLNENCQSLSFDCIESLIDTWKQLANRVYYFHRVACKAYFTYLNLSAQNSTLSQNEGNISATLRILKILIKYATELKEDLQKGLSKTPTQPWLLTIPQLFCRLNHPEPYVRQSVSELLCRIARDFPHLIIYPAVVGSQDGPTKIENVHKSSNNNKKNNYPKLSQQNIKEDVGTGSVGEDVETVDAQPDDFDEIEIKQEEASNEIKQVDEDDDNEVNEQEEEEEEDEEDDEEMTTEEKKVELKNSYKCLLDTLAQTNPKMIEEVKLFVHELRRVTLLREELWLGTLNQIHSDANKRMDQLATEITKINANTSLNEDEKTKITKEKYEIIMYPIISVLEHVNQITTNTIAETPNEEKFSIEFAPKINDALKQLKNVEMNALKPFNGWSLFKQLHQILYQRSQRPKANSLLMDQISPKLAMIKSSTIPIPDKDGQYCSLHSIMPNVFILPTKTKPKKLYFIGSNGKRYPYLFKGLEDLHLDERIMQLLSIVNTMFGKINKSEFPNYNALHYSVTPLGPRSGLISWVENSTPLFLLYKKWQQREHSYLATKQIQQQMLRPTEMFYNKLNPLLKEKCIKNFAECRQECPVSLLRQVLDELIKETPNDLLSKELWCHSSTPGNWWKSVQVYSRSTAVMSIIGYVIGLGDRHLDNILVNLTSGEVAHIDYNICFEKGLNLRIPERVPFRMTQNLQYALGMSGIEGVFRLSCENVLKTLKTGRETLLTLLEAFVYDPLLDWTGNDTGIIASFYGGGQTSVKASTSLASNSDTTDSSQFKSKQDRRFIERKMTLRLFQIRLIENANLLKSNEQGLMQLVNNFETSLTFLCDLKQKREYKENLIRLHELAKIHLDESLTLHNDNNKTKVNQHAVYTLHDRYAKYSVYTQHRDTVFKSIKSLCDNLKKLVEKYSGSIDYVKSLVNFDQSKDPLTQLVQSVALFSNENNTIMQLLTDKSGRLDQAPYLVTVDFFQSISQLNLTNQCENLYKELDQIKTVQKNLLVSLYNLIRTKSTLFNWLPADYFSRSSLTKCIQWMDMIREAFEENNLKNNSKIIQSVQKVYQQYKSDFNPLFRLKSQKSLPREPSLPHLVSESKYIAFKYELDETIKKIELISLRKSSIEAQNEYLMSESLSLEQSLLLKHDECELEMFNFIDKELSSVQSAYDLVDLQIFDAFGFVSLQFLNENLQKWMLMENASLEAKEQLISLTSIEGDWFLEEMYSLIANCNHLTRLIQKLFAKFNLIKDLDCYSGMPFSKFLESCDTLTSLLTNLKKLLFSFQINLSEKLIKMAFSNSNELQYIIEQFKQINTDQFFEYISRENFSIENFANDTECMDKLNEIKTKYSQILTNKTNQIGVLVLIELEKLFNKLDTDFDRITKFLKAFYSQDQFNGQTYFNLAPNLVYLLDDRVLTFYKNLFQVKKIQAISTCMNICSQFYQYCYGTDDSFNLNQEQIVLPLKAYISDFVVQMMVGIPTVILGSLINSFKINKLPQIRSECVSLAVNSSPFEERLQLEFLLNQNLMNNQLNENYLNRFNQFLINYDNLWSSVDLLRRIDSNIKFTKIHENITRNLYQAFQWYHDPFLSKQKETERDEFLKELNQIVENLKSNIAFVENTIEKLNAAELTIGKRLEWAAGSSTNLLDTLKAFESLRKNRNDYFKNDVKLARSIETFAENLNDFEQMRIANSTNQIEKFQLLENVLIDIEEFGFLNEENISPSINEYEISLMNFQSFKDKKPLNNAIIQEYYKLLFDEVAQMKRNKQKEDKDCMAKMDEINTNSTEFKSLLNQHNKIMNDIKPLLKTLNKISENKRLHQYTKIYGQFSEGCQYLVRNITNEEIIQNKPNELLNKLELLKEIIPKIYSELRTLNEEPDKKSADQQQLLVNEKLEEKKNTVVRFNSKTGKIFQECNSHAISVWKRVSQKLDGKDPDQTKVLSVQEQIDYLINQATDLNNLASLYEGWTPWV